MFDPRQMQAQALRNIQALYNPRPHNTPGQMGSGQIPMMDGTPQPAGWASAAQAAGSQLGATQSGMAPQPAPYPQGGGLSGGLQAPTYGRQPLPTPMRPRMPAPFPQGGAMTPPGTNRY